jgi:hypothetical protein
MAAEARLKQFGARAGGATAAAPEGGALAGPSASVSQFGTYVVCDHICQLCFSGEPVKCTPNTHKVTGSIPGESDNGM